MTHIDESAIGCNQPGLVSLRSIMSAAAVTLAAVTVIVIVVLVREPETLS